MNVSSDATAAYAAESRVPQILLGTIIPSCISTTFVLGRLYSRAFLTRNLGQDDAWIGISAVVGISITIINCLFVSYGWGHHQEFLTYDDSIVASKMSYAARILYQIVLGTTKIGLLAFYLRVFTDRKSKLLIQCMIGFVVLFAFPLVIYVIAACRPAITAGQHAEPVCDTNSPDLYLSAICNILTDFLLLVFVIPRVVPLKMAKRQKIALLSVVCLGALVVVAAIVRLVEVTAFNNSTDQTWNVTYITTWSSVEINTGLFCASAPAIRPLLRKILPKFITSSFSETHSNPTWKQGLSNYGAGTHVTHTHPSGAFELDSQTDLHHGFGRNRNDTVITNKAWRGDGGEGEGKGKYTHWDDSNSEDAVLAEDTAATKGPMGAIVKTVSVTVTSNQDDESRSMERRNSVGRFEPV